MALRDHTVPRLGGLAAERRCHAISAEGGLSRRATLACGGRQGSAKIPEPQQF